MTFYKWVPLQDLVDAWLKCETVLPQELMRYIASFVCCKEYEYSSSDRAYFGVLSWMCGTEALQMRMWKVIDEARLSPAEIGLYWKEICSKYPEETNARVTHSIARWYEENTGRWLKRQKGDSQ